MTDRPSRLPDAVDYDAELHRHDEVLRAACAIQPDEHVVDIGCGTGHTSREAARLTRTGAVLGVDVSAAAIERARELAQAVDVRNVSFECADAQVCRFVPGSFDVAISRFGTMFFTDPTAAFANIRGALRADGRLVMMVWQARDRNEWDVAIRGSLGEPPLPPAPDRDAPDAFSLADPAVISEVLGPAGFTDLAFADVLQPVYYGPDVEHALAWVSGFTATRRVLEQLGPEGAGAAVRRLGATLAGHLADDGVWFDSRAWIVTARAR